MELDCSPTKEPLILEYRHCATMKRIRRRPNHTRSGGGMRRSISHPASRRESLVPKMEAKKEEFKQQQVLTGMDVSCESISIVPPDEEPTDLEAGCPTKEERRSLLPSTTNKKNDDEDEMPDYITTPASVKCQRFTHRLRRFWSSVPLFLKVVLVTHSVACWYALYALFFYTQLYHGTVWACIITLSIATTFWISTVTAIATARQANVVLAEVLDQEGKSRALLNTLYPAKILEQMFDELLPEQIEEAQQQQQQMRLSIQQHDQNQLLNTSSSFHALTNLSQSFNLSSRSLLGDLDDSAASPLLGTGPTALRRTTSANSSRAKRRNSVKRSNSGLLKRQNSGLKRQNSGLKRQNSGLKRQNPSMLMRQNSGLIKRQSSFKRGLNLDNNKKQQQQDKNTTTSAATKGNPNNNTGNSDEVVVVDRKSLGYDEPHTSDATANHSTATNNNKTTLNNTTTTHSATATTTTSRTKPQATFSTINHSDGGGGDNEVLCVRRNSLTLRRRSMSKRASMGQRRMSMGLLATASGSHSGKSRRRSSVGSTRSVSSNASSTGKPIQERFQETTVLFADIAGFTQWCGEREPCHVFQLLENVFFNFDNLAKALGVYKIETIGDCYVAVTGIPNPMDDHAGAMAKFASQIIQEFDMVVAALASEDEEDGGGLGADTATLRLRVGCHSGPTVAGVLRGDRGRFQLFGDTVNTAARMESNGLPGKVQISEEMALALALDGKGNWYYPRPDKIVAKGKGELQTFWLKDDLMGNEPTTTADGGGDKTSSSELKPTAAVTRATSDQPPQQPKRQDMIPEESSFPPTPRESLKHSPSMWLDMEDVTIATQQQQLAETNFQILELMVKKITAHHTAHQMDCSCGNSSMMIDEFWGAEEPLHYEEHDGSILEELRSVATDTIPTTKQVTVNPTNVVLPAGVVRELRAFVKALDSSFQKANPFSNFQHACHMARSMLQLLEHLERSSTSASLSTTTSNSASSFNGNGILPQDPMAQFVIILTCMVQDVDNPGVTNEQLMKEDSDMAEYFHNTGLMQQNALDVAWELLVGPTCENLLKAICSHSPMELERFRKYMVHAMMATDREDQGLSQERFKRWMEAMMKVGSQQPSNKRDSMSASSRRGKRDSMIRNTSKISSDASKRDSSSMTDSLRRNSQQIPIAPTWHQSIVMIEQCMQLSNVIHAVQTPELFAKWNERLFREQYLAYIKGRRDQDPSEHFFDEHLELLRRIVVPLAERYQHSANNKGMLGTCEELGRQAKLNLEDWKTRGRVSVQEMAASAKYEYGEKQQNTEPPAKGQTPSNQ